MYCDSKLIAIGSKLIAIGSKRIAIEMIVRNFVDFLSKRQYSELLPAATFDNHNMLLTDMLVLLSSYLFYLRHHHLLNPVLHGRCCSLPNILKNMPMHYIFECRISFDL